jgi:hypothetical protein
MKGAILILAWLLAAPAFAQTRTIAVEADGELPGFDTAGAAPWLAAQMNQAGLADWHFAPRDAGVAAPDRVEWRFELLPYAGGGVRQFFPQPGGGVLKARHLVSAEARLFLHGQYETMTLAQEAVAGGAADPILAAFILRATRMLDNGWRATDTAPAHGPVR